MEPSETRRGPAAGIGDQLSYLRRYARALTGSQSNGDAYAAATLEAILAGRNRLKIARTDKVGLFRTFHAIWHSTGTPSGPFDKGPRARAGRHLAKLTPNSREALLLSAIEGFSLREIGEILGLDTEEAERLLSAAYVEMEDAVSGRVLVIEDEPIIALDLKRLVAEAGHSVTGVARDHRTAVRLGTTERPDLIMADVQLVGGSSGISAVNELRASLGDIPVIFVTAFPERLLTGERPEPAFLIAKPYSETQVRTAVSQAMFFSSTEVLLAGE